MAASILGLDHVQVAAPPGCEPAARRFYGELLGMEEVPKPPGVDPRGAWFRAGAHELHVGVQDPHTPSHKAHPGFKVTDIGTLHDALATAGVPVEWDTRIPERRRFYATDPWGNRIELTE